MEEYLDRENIINIVEKGYTTENVIVTETGSWSEEESIQCYSSL